MGDGRASLPRARRWVVKIGSALLTDNGRGLRVDLLENWVGQMAELCRQDKEIALVSSGSIAEGIFRLGWKRRPRAIHELQAAAAVGQMGLVQAYESGFQRYGMRTAQVLLTHDDMSERQRYLNARSTLRSLLALRVIPVVNENDTVATDEIRFGDNDTLAGLLANLIEAEVLVILTDQEGLYERDPRRDPKAKLLEEGRAGDPGLEVMAGEGGAWGRGGMRTKLKAAALAARSGTATVIASGLTPAVLARISSGEGIGTFLEPGRTPLAARKQWLAGHLQLRGRLVLDEGAVEVLHKRGKSLLAVGVTAVEGDFNRGEVVACVGPDGREIARGLVNYNANETRHIMGQPSDRIEELLGYVDEPELIHRDNLVLL
ncbi:MAG: glutamate 5-kinase [Gammaproteobacteria bacterium]|nr:glutamate 5-kinase [Gammaproteobacteria bacterium]